MKTIAFIARSNRDPQIQESINEALSQVPISFTQRLEPDGLYYDVEDGDYAAAAALVPEEYRVDEE